MHKHASSGQTTGSNRAERRRLKREASAPKPAQSADPHAAQITGHLKEAESLRAAGKIDQAEGLCRQILQTYPKSPSAHCAVGMVLEHRGNDKAALEYFKQAATLAPNDALCWLRLGSCLSKLQHTDAALIANEKALNLSPRDVHALLATGAALQAVERHEDALAMFAKARKLHPKNAIAHLKEGRQHQTLGDFERARSLFKRAIKLNPNLVEAQAKLSAMATEPEELEEAIAKLKALASKPDIKSSWRANALFAAGRVSLKQKQHADAFEFYRRANNELRENVHFKREALTKFVDELMAAYMPDVFDIQKDAALETNAPVFIVGMPRSGTTLVEQIVSSHPQVSPGGEEAKMSELVNALVQQKNVAVRYPVDVAKILPAGLKSIGEHYFAHMSQRFPDAARFTDKNPFNFFQVGLLAVLFPNATIIHCHRDARDTCLSCYFQHFAEAKTMDFTTDLEDLGFFYNNYKRLMEHWNAVLPNRIVNVRYEDMVADQEAMSRMIIDRVGLEWDDACLKFNENKRGVLTASQWQVRQPIYTSSLERWRKYETELAPLIQVLDEAA